MIRPVRTLLALFIIAASLAAVSKQETPARPDPLDELTLEERRSLRATPITRVIARYGPAVVNIYGESTGPRLAPATARNTPPPKETLGSGFLIDADGYILTNTHVIRADVPRLIVRLSNGSEHRAWLMNLDPDNDVALLKIDAGYDLPTVRMGTSTDLMVGETVIAMGSPFGNDNSVTAGIISSLYRDVRVPIPNNGRAFTSSFGDFIQIDAPINPGNSGGPLFNILGEVIGITSAVFRDSEGLGFAIPIDRVRGELSDNLLSPRRRGIDLGFALHFRLSTQKVLVAELDEGSPAMQAGLQSGDALVRVGDQVVGWEFDVNKALLASQAGDVVEFVVERTETQRNGDRVTRRHTLDIPLGTTNSPNLVVEQLMGISAWDHPRYLGVFVQHIDPSGPGNLQLDLQYGDVIDGVGDADIDSVADLAQQLAAIPSGSWVEIKGFRGRQGFVGTMRIP